MKKLALSYLITGLLLVSCSSTQLKTDSKIPSKSWIDHYQNSPHRITINRANEMKKNHDEVIKPVLEKFQKKNRYIERSEYEPSEFVWVSFEELKAYVLMLEEVQRLNGQEITGVAINFASYGYKDEVDDKKNKNQYHPYHNTNRQSSIRNRYMDRFGDYRGRISMIMMPTFVEKGTNSKDIKNHKQFYIQPQVGQNNAFFGKYIPVERFNKGMSNSRFWPLETTFKNLGSSASTEYNTNIYAEQTELTFEELMGMPPRKP
ncbi:MAG: hypothetical protein ACK5MZ_09365 [Aestuariibaculum sp.]